VAEAPPTLDRYFYFEEVEREDWLWIALMKALYPNEWSRTNEERKRKPYWLRKFKQGHFRLIDAVKTPIGGTGAKRVTLIRATAHELVDEILEIDPEQIVLIKASVHEALFQQLKDAGLPLVNKEPLPFPCSGHQTEFHDEIRRLVDAGKLRLC
jgi:hypothetical protein